MKDNQIVTLESIECPECGKSLSTEENTTQLCNDPFNGICVECDCGAEVSLDILVKVRLI
jgi:hypothetical protein